MSSWYLFLIISPNCPHGSQRTESEMLMLLSTAIPCEVSAVQSAPHGEVNAVPGTGLKGLG